MTIIDYCIERISRVDIVKIALDIIYKESIYSDFKIFCEYFFQVGNADFVDKIWTKYKEISDAKTIEEIVLNHGRPVATLHTGMELLRYAFSFPFRDTTEYSYTELEQNLYILPFCAIGGKILYPEHEIEKLLKTNFEK